MAMSREYVEKLLRLAEILVSGVPEANESVESAQRQCDIINALPHNSLTRLVAILSARCAVAEGLIEPISKEPDSEPEPTIH